MDQIIKELRELKKKRKTCEDFILKHLDELDEDVIDITGGKLRKNKSETKIPLNNDIIKQAIEFYVKDESKVKLIIDKMTELRPKNVRYNLKRTTKRGKRKKK